MPSCSVALTGGVRTAAALPRAKMAPATGPGTLLHQSARPAWGPACRKDLARHLASCTCDGREGCLRKDVAVPTIPLQVGPLIASAQTRT